uniref:Methylated-DNA--protein-cysteine methyltransferase n=1 Tax=Macaca nemestrina TaxID=9545 RepID=A0A2K6D7I0_MACNE
MQEKRPSPSASSPSCPIPQTLQETLAELLLQKVPGPGGLIRGLVSPVEGPRGLLSPCSHFCSAMEVPAPAEVLGGPEPLMQCTAWLNAYFHQPEAVEELPVPALHHPIFQQESFTRQVLWKLLKVVKFGEVISYQQLAALAGNPKAARAVGGAMRNNPVPILIPCHRVVCSSGAVGNYSGGLAVKEWLLVHEGHRAGKPGLGGSSGLAEAWLKRAGATSGSLPAGRN